MVKKDLPSSSEAEKVPTGYGRLVAATALGSKDAVLWFEDSAGTIRAVHVACGTTSGLELAIKGQAQVTRA